jgi:putative RecB family exonuclease
MRCCVSAGGIAESLPQRLLISSPRPSSVPRVQSASSINLFKECPRKYFYRYIMGYEILPSIYMTRGSIVHSVLEVFFDTPLDGVTDADFRSKFQSRVFSALIKEWDGRKEELAKFKLSAEQLQLYFEETVVMLLNWLRSFCDKLERRKKPLAVAFKELSPVAKEKLYESQKHAVKGFIDTVFHVDGEVHIMDYKTSKSPEITDEYHLQLAIYAMLYEESHGVPPHKVGINFLRHGEKVLPVDQQLIEFAKREVALVHQKTQSDRIDDYPKCVSSACRWCDFYKHCFQQRSIRDVLAEQANGSQRSSSVVKPVAPS